MDGHTLPTATATARAIDHTMPALLYPPSSAIDPLRPSPRLPNELLAYLLEFLFLSSSPTQLLPPALDEDGTPIARQPLRSMWDARVNLLLVSKIFYCLARRHLHRTIALNSPRALDAYFTHLLDDPEGPQLFAGLDRAWFANLSAAHRLGHNIDPLQYRLKEAAWYEETAGGFVIGHAYASRAKPVRCKRRSPKRPKATRRVSVYWAEEEIIEEVSDQDSSGSESDGEDDVDEEADAGRCGEADGQAQGQGQGQRQGASGEAHPARPGRQRTTQQPAWQTLYASNRTVRTARDNGHRPNFEGPRRRVAMSATLSGPVEGELDPWDMVEAQERLSLQTSHALPLNVLAPTDVVLDSPSTSTGTSSVDALGLDGSPSERIVTGSETPVTRTANIAALVERRNERRRQLFPREEPSEIVAYHLVTATLENWINRMLSEIRTLRYITLTFYPGTLLDDDKLEHVLRRILSAEENPKLEQLLVRIAHEPVAAGSRFRRLDRAMTIGGAVNRIGDDRIRVEGVSTAVGGGLVSQVDPSSFERSGVWESASSPRGASSTSQANRQSSPGDRSSRSASPPGLTLQECEMRQGSMERLNEASRRAVRMTEDGWWSRILQQNRARLQTPYVAATSSDSLYSTKQETDANDEDDVEPYSSIFGHKKARTLRTVLAQADPFYNAPIPIGAAMPGNVVRVTKVLLEEGVDEIELRTGYRQLQLNYVNGWAMRDRNATNGPIEE